MKVRHTFPSYRCGLPYDDPQNSKVEERIFSISGFTNESSHAGSADWEESSNLHSLLCYNLDTILSDKYFRGKNLTVRSSTTKLKKYWGSKIGLKQWNPKKKFRSNPFPETTELGIYEKKYLKITRSDRKSTSSSFVEKSWDHTLDLKLGRKIVKLFRYHNFYSKNSKIKILIQSFKNF